MGLADAWQPASHLARVPDPHRIPRREGFGAVNLDTFKNLQDIHFGATKRKDILILLTKKV